MIDWRVWNQLLREITRDARFELQHEVERFSFALEDWINALVWRPLPADWRTQTAGFLFHWEQEGFQLTPRSLAILDWWIEAWAKRRGSLRKEEDRRASSKMAQTRSAVVVANQTPRETRPKKETITQVKPPVGRETDRAPGASPNRKQGSVGEPGRGLRQNPDNIEAGNNDGDRHVDINQARFTGSAGFRPLTFGRIANFVYERDHYKESLLDGPIRIEGPVFSGESIGGVSPEFRNLKVEIIADPQTGDVRLKTLDLPMPIKITRSYKGQPFTIAEINSIRAHEQKHLDAYQAVLTHVFTCVNGVNALVARIRDRQLRLFVAKKLAPILETDAKNFLVRRVNIEGLRQAHHLDFFNAKMRDVQNGRILELNRTYRDFFGDLLANERQRVARDFANQGVQLDPNDRVADVAAKASARVNYYDTRYDASIDAIKRAVQTIIARQP